MNRVDQSGVLQMKGTGHTCNEVCELRVVEANQAIFDKWRDSIFSEEDVGEEELLGET